MPKPYFKFEPGITVYASTLTRSKAQILEQDLDYFEDGRAIRRYKVRWLDEIMPTIQMIRAEIMENFYEKKNKTS